MTKEYEISDILPQHKIPIADIPLPGQEEKAEFAFRKKLRDWYLRVAGNQCQTFIYSEQSGWQVCGSSQDLEVDHIKPEAWLLETGEEDPDNTMGIPRCRKHHVGRGLVVDNGSTRYAAWGEPEYSRHPDVGEALGRYHQSPFGREDLEEVFKQHKEKAKTGWRFWNSDDGVDAFEREHMQDLISKYVAENPHDPRPQMPKHKKFRKRRWYDGLF